MARTTGQTFRFSAVDHDGSWGTDIRQADTGNPATNATTINNAGTSTAANVNIVCDPYTTRSTTGSGSSTEFGWAINRDAASTDGMDSLSGARRIIPAGTWSVQAPISIPVAGTATGTITASYRFSFYRVSSDGLTRTLLFQINTNTAQSTALVAVNAEILTGSAASPPLIVFEPGETLLMTIQTFSTQVAGLAGATVTANLTLTTGPNALFTLPSPGVRTLYSSSHVAAAVGAMFHRVKVGKTLPIVGIAAVVFLRLIGLRFPVTGSTVATMTKKILPNRFLVTGVSVVSTIKKLFKTVSVVGVGSVATTKKMFKTVAVTGSTVAAFSRALIAARAFVVQGTAVSFFSRAIIAVRSFPVQGVASPLLFVKIPQAALNRLGGGAVTVIKRSIYIFDD